MSLLNFIYIFITAMFTSMVMVPPISNLAVRIGGIDRPDARKVHVTETPRLGGIVVFFAFILPIHFYCVIDNQLKGIMAGAVIIFLVGLADDLADLNPKKKLLGQFAAAAIVVIYGNVRLGSLGNPLGLGEIELGLFAIPFSIFALVGVMNAINLLDGLDGLAGGVSAIVCVVFGALAYKTGDYPLVCLTIALLGGIVGFLNYNTYPARIFMGDSGSLLLGYCLGTFAIMLVSGSNGQVSPYIPLIVLAVPILDTLVVMTNRIKKRRRLFLPDRSHLHHRLLDLGFGHKFAVIIVYGITYLLSIFAIIGRRFEDYHLAVGLLTGFVIIYTSLHLFSHYGIRSRLSLLISNQSLRETEFHKWLLKFSPILLRFVKYLLMAILILSIFIPYAKLPAGAAIPGFLLLLVTALFFTTSEFGNKALQLALYFSGAFIIFQMENFGRVSTLFGMPVLLISNQLFFALLACGVSKLFLEKRTKILTNSPLEYFVFFIALVMPLLPSELTREYHLLTVGGKSIILFFAYKMVLMSEIRRNRKILFVTFLALGSELLHQLIE